MSEPGITLLQREKRWPFETLIAEIKLWQEATRLELRQTAGRPAAGLTGTLAADVDRFLAFMVGLAS